MEAIELIQLGRRLTKLGEQALRGSNGSTKGDAEIPVGATLVAHDVLVHDGSTVSEITARTGLPQSYVSESVARLRDATILLTETDPDDRRRTRVRMSPQHLKSVRQKGRAPVDDLVVAALGDVDPAQSARLLSALTTIAELMRSDTPGPAMRLLAGAD
jgi:DNA-binding MarR family transcriptional regulator